MRDASETAGRTGEVRLWDPVTRLLHWALAVAVATAWGLGEFGPAIMTLHFWAGYAVLALIALRVVWGIVGPRPARFASFAYGPRAVLSYLGRHFFRRRPSNWPGHNPMGAWSVFALLGLLTAHAGLGLISDPDDYINVGPLAGMVEFETARWANGLHHDLSTAVLALVGLHVAVVVYYRVWKGENLVRAMVLGDRRVGTEPGSRD